MSRDLLTVRLASEIVHHYSRWAGITVHGTSEWSSAGQFASGTIVAVMQRRYPAVPISGVTEKSPRALDFITKIQKNRRQKESKRKTRYTFWAALNDRPACNSSSRSALKYSTARWVTIFPGMLCLMCAKHLLTTHKGFICYWGWRRLRKGCLPSVCARWCNADQRT
jgi:hypothetical protein